MTIADDKTPLFLATPFSQSADWRSDAAPPDGSIVDVYSSDHHGPYAIPFPVTFRDDRWWNAQTGDELEAYVEGWRPRRSRGVA